MEVYPLMGTDCSRGLTLEALTGRKSRQTPHVLHQLRYRHANDHEVAQRGGMDRGARLARLSTHAPLQA